MCPSQGHSIRAEKLDQAIWTWVIAAFENPEHIRAAYERWKAGETEGRSHEYDRLPRLAELVEEAEARWRNCLTSAAQARDERTRAQFTIMADEASDEMRQYQKDHERLAEILARQDSKHAFVENLIAMGSRALDWLRAANYQDKRMALHSIGVKVYAKTATDYDIVWRFGETIEQWTQEPLETFVSPTTDGTTRAGR
jgi:hypothetical protein